MKRIYIIILSLICIITFTSNYSLANSNYEFDIAKGVFMPITNWRKTSKVDLSEDFLTVNQHKKEYEIYQVDNMYFYKMKLKGTYYLFASRDLEIWTPINKSEDSILNISKFGDYYCYFDYKESNKNVLNIYKSQNGYDWYKANFLTKTNVYDEGLGILNYEGKDYFITGPATDINTQQVSYALFSLSEDGEDLYIDKIVGLKEDSKFNLSTKFLDVEKVKSFILDEDNIKVVEEKDTTNDIKLRVNSEYIELEEELIVKNDRILVPIRFISEYLGAQVDWNPEYRIVTIRKNPITIKLEIGLKTIAVANMGFSVYEDLDVAPELINKRTYVPLRFVGQAFGGTVDWDYENKTAIINIFDSLVSDYGGFDSLEEYLDKGDYDVINYGKYLIRLPKFNPYLQPILPKEIVGNEIPKILELESKLELTSGEYRTTSDKITIAGNIIKSKKIGSAKVSSNNGSIYNINITPKLDPNDLNFNALEKLKIGLESMSQVTDYILSKIITDDMTDIEKVKTVYDYIITNYEYNEDYKTDKTIDIRKYINGQDFIENKAANGFFLLYNKVGLSEHFASLFTTIMWRLGYDADLVYGYQVDIENNTAPYTWSKIRINDEWYHFDTATESLLYKSTNTIDYSFFMKHETEIQDFNNHK